MTAIGILYPGHSAEDDYPRIEQLIGGNIRLPLVHTDPGPEGSPAPDPAAPGDATRTRRLAEGMEELRLAGAEAVVWAAAEGPLVRGTEGAREQVRRLAADAGLPASSTSLAFPRAVRELGLRRVAVAGAFTEETARLFADFLGAFDVEVVAVRGCGAEDTAESAGWDLDRLREAVLAADHPRAEAVILPDTALHTAAHLRELEAALGKPVLTSSQVTTWEALRLADRRVNAPGLGALFTREPVVQAPD